MQFKKAKDINDPQECIDQIQERLTWLSEIGIPEARESEGEARTDGTRRMVGHCKTDLNRLDELVHQFAVEVGLARAART